MVREDDYTPPFDTPEQSTAAHARQDATDTPAALADNDAAMEDQENVDQELAEDDLVAARQAWEADDAAERVDERANTDAEAIADATDLADAPVQADSADGQADASLAEEQQAEHLAHPFVGRWNELISSTNWEKGHIITQWRAALIQSGAAPTEYSDEAWSRRVGGVTASHVGRLRRVYEAFASSYQSYPGLYWTHFLVALDWDDAPLWLEGAAQSGWSVSAMRQQRWQATGGDEATRPREGDVISSDLDEDFSADSAAAEFTQPGQGGGSTKNYDDGPNAVGASPAVEGPDFGEEESLNRISTDFDADAVPEPAAVADPDEAAAPLVQPFAGLPELPNDLADAVELLKLAVLRHKTAGWKEVSAEAVAQYLQAFAVLIEARGK